LEPWQINYFSRLQSNSAAGQIAWGKMLLQKTEATKTQSRQQRQRCERFAAATADAIGAAGNCLFSLLPYQERRRQAASWYEACAQAMLCGNYALLDEWIRQQTCTAAAENFELNDLLQLLRICRRSAIQIDGWDEDIFSGVDEVINEGLRAIRAHVSWNIPNDLNYLTEAGSRLGRQPKSNETETNARAQAREDDRRRSGRNRLALPIRVRCTTDRNQTEEINSTLNVSLSGFYFSTRENYKIGSRLQVAFPYWAAPGSINREYAARVTRLDPLPDGSLGVAVEFLESLRNKTP